MSDVFSITNGPDRMLLVISLVEGNPTPRKTVTFETESPTGHLEVAITALEQEDGSGHCWNFKGYGKAGQMRSQVHGFYRTNTRKGWFAWGPQRPH